MARDHRHEWYLGDFALEHKKADPEKKRLSVYVETAKGYQGIGGRWSASVKDGTKVSIETVVIQQLSNELLKQAVEYAAFLYDRHSRRSDDRYAREAAEKALFVLDTLYNLMAKRLQRRESRGLGAPVVP